MDWYRSQLSDVERTGRKSRNGVEYWKKVLTNRFKESHSDALHALQRTKYSLTNAQNNRPPTSYVYDVVRHAKSLDASTVHAQLTWAYNNLDLDLVRDINEPNSSTTIMQFIESMEAKQNAWKGSLLKHWSDRFEFRYQPEWSDCDKQGWSNNSSCPRGNFFR